MSIAFDGISDGIIKTLEECFGKDRQAKAVGVTVFFAHKLRGRRMTIRYR